MPTPCRFLNCSLRRSRSAISSVMSTSLKVVSIAAVRCASTRLRAIVSRRFDIRTRSSVRLPGGDGRTWRCRRRQARASAPRPARRPGRRPPPVLAWPERRRPRRRDASRGRRHRCPAPGSCRPGALRRPCARQACCAAPSATPAGAAATAGVRASGGAGEADAGASGAAAAPAAARRRRQRRPRSPRALRRPSRPRLPAAGSSPSTPA